MSHVNLGELINFLRTLDPGGVVSNGFASPHSDRGDYSELAFSPVDETTVGAMLKWAESAVNKMFEGYKGGNFTMTLVTPVYIGHWGDCGEPITHTHFKYWSMFGIDTITPPSARNLCRANEILNKYTNTQLNILALAHQLDEDDKEISGD